MDFFPRRTSEYRSAAQQKHSREKEMRWNFPHFLPIASRLRIEMNGASSRMSYSATDKRGGRIGWQNENHIKYTYNFFFHHYSTMLRGENLGAHTVKFLLNKAWGTANKIHWQKPHPGVIVRGIQAEKRSLPQFPHFLYIRFMENHSESEQRQTFNLHLSKYIYTILRDQNARGRLSYCCGGWGAARQYFLSFDDVTGRGLLSLPGNTLCSPSQRDRSVFCDGVLYCVLWQSCDMMMVFTAWIL